ANIAPPAVINHTSLASQNGPIVLIYTCFSLSVLPKKRATVPTPKSKPSKTKNPMNNIVIKINQNSLRDKSSIYILFIDRIHYLFLFFITMIFFLYMTRKQVN